jgi:hypothetical protein
VERSGTRRLHLLFTDSRHLHLGFSTGADGSPLANGFLRLKLPLEALSRSTLKLEEALLRPGLVGLRHGGTTPAHRRPGGRLAHPRRLPARHLQPLVAHEEAL